MLPAEESTHQPKAGSESRNANSAAVSEAGEAITEDGASAPNIFSPSVFRAVCKHLEKVVREERLNALAASSIDDATKSEIGPVVENYLYSVAPTLAVRRALFLSYWTADTNDRLVNASLFLAFIVLAATLILGQSGPVGWWDVLAGMVSVPLMILGMFCSIVLGKGLMWLFNRFASPSVSRLFAFVLTMLVFVALGQYVAHSGGPNWIVISVQSASWAVAAFLGVVIIVLQGLLFALELVWRRAIPKFPDAEIVAAVLDLLGALQATRQKWGTDSKLAQLVDAGLEFLANLIERAFPYRMGENPTRDVTDRLKKEAWPISAAVRGWRRNVLVRGASGFQDVQAKLESMLVHIARGNWDLLERGEASPYESYRTSRALRFLKLALVAVLPFVALRVLRSDVLSFAEAEGIASILDGVASLWFVVIMLEAFHPKAFDIVGMAGKLKN
jgi:hypothetical protein